METLKKALVGLLFFITDLRFFFHKDFFKENYYLHFILSVLISFGIVLFAREYMYLVDTALWFQLFIGGFAAFFINGVREIVVETREVPFSWTDINFGTYGGIVGAFLVTLLF